VIRRGSPKHQARQRLTLHGLPTTTVTGPEVHGTRAGSSQQDSAAALDSLAVPFADDEDYDETPTTTPTTACPTPTSAVPPPGTTSPTPPGAARPPPHHHATRYLEDWTSPRARHRLVPRGLDLGRTATGHAVISLAAGARNPELAGRSDGRAALSHDDGTLVSPAAARHSTQPATALRRGPHVAA